VAHSSDPAVKFKWRTIDSKAQPYDQTRTYCDFEAKRATAGRFPGGRPYARLEAWVEIFAACMKTRGYEIHGVDYE